jgi:hypothetical protein
MVEQTQCGGLFMDCKLGEANEIKAALRELSLIMNINISYHEHQIK